MDKTPPLSADVPASALREEQARAAEAIAGAERARDTAAARRNILLLDGPRQELPSAENALIEARGEVDRASATHATISDQLHEAEAAEREAAEQRIYAGDGRYHRFDGA